VPHFGGFCAGGGATSHIPAASGPKRPARPRPSLSLWTWAQGSVASSLCTAAHSLATGFAERLGASLSEMAMRLRPDLDGGELVAAGDVLLRGVGDVLAVVPVLLGVEELARRLRGRAGRRPPTSRRFPPLCRSSSALLLYGGPHGGTRGVHYMRYKTGELVPVALPLQKWRYRICPWIWHEVDEWEYKATMRPSPKGSAAITCSRPRALLSAFCQASMSARPDLAAILPGHGRRGHSPTC
jgi:hypothetical protein